MSSIENIIGTATALNDLHGSQADNVLVGAVSCCERAQKATLRAEIAVKLPAWLPEEAQVPSRS